MRPSRVAARPGSTSDVWSRRSRSAHRPACSRCCCANPSPSAGTAAPAAGALLGQGASPGRATGRVRIVSGPEDFDAFQPGEVLVAQATAPAWTPLFGRAAAVVTDGGTLAAHASLVAREYGIPAVVGTGQATRRLATGQLVRVDGTTGTVAVVGDRSP